MIAEDTFRRYTANWGALALAGLFALLVNLVVGLLGGLLLIPVMVSAGLSLATGGGGVDSLVGIIAGAGISLLLIAAVTVLVTPIGLGGLMHGVVQVQRGQPASFGELWQAGLSNWKRLLVLNLIIFVVLLVLMVILLIVRLIPFLGPLVWGMGTALVMLALGGYGPYIAVSQQVGGAEAASRAFRILSAKCVDLLMTLGVLALAGIALGLISAVLSRVPLIGQLVPLAMQVFVTPLGLLYLATRYQRNIAPDLGPPGGGGRFDPGPPSGE